MAGISRRVPWIRTLAPLVLIPAALAVLMLIFAPGAVRRWTDALGLRIAGGGSTLRLATAGDYGMYHRYGDLLREVTDARSNYKLTVLTTPGSMANLDLLREGEADFAFIQGGLGVPLDGVEVVAAIEWQYAHIIVPASTGIDEFRALQGKRVGVGPAGSGFESLAGRVFGYYNFYVAPVQVTDHNPDLIEAFGNDEIDAAFTVYSLFSPAVETLLATGWYKLLPIGEAEAIARYMPGVEAAVMPHGLYGPDRSIPPQRDGPMESLAVDTLLVARSDTSHGAVRALLEGLHNPEFMLRARLNTPPDRNRVEGRPAHVHPAAANFYARNDPVSSDLFEIASFFLAGLLGLVSLTHYLIGRAQQRQKEKRRRAIQPYFEQMLDFGNGVQAAGDPGILTGLLHDMMEVQRDAEHAWLRGELDTEDMENLYSIYGIRSGNASLKIQNLLSEQEIGAGTSRSPAITYPKVPDEENFFEAPSVPLPKNEVMEVETAAEHIAAPEVEEPPLAKKTPPMEEPPMEEPPLAEDTSPAEDVSVSAPASPPSANLRKTAARKKAAGKKAKDEDQMRLF